MDHYKVNTHVAIIQNLNNSTQRALKNSVSSLTLVVISKPSFVVSLFFKG